MTQGTEAREQSDYLEDPYQLRLMSLLRELVNEKGPRGAARELGVDHRTVASNIEGGKLSKRVQKALEVAIATGADPESASQREHLASLETRVGELEQLARAGQLENRRAIEEGLTELREDHLRALQHIEKRLAALESGLEGRGNPRVTVQVNERPAAQPLRRQYRDLVTCEPEPGEEQIYGDAASSIVEWRQARTESLVAKTKLDKAIAEERRLRLEIEMLEMHELTLPPHTYPLDSLGRRSEAQSRQRVLEEVRLERAMATARRWLRRVLTLGIWRN